MPIAHEYDFPYSLFLILIIRPDGPKKLADRYSLFAAVVASQKAEPAVLRSHLSGRRFPRGCLEHFQLCVL